MQQAAGGGAAAVMAALLLLAACHPAAAQSVTAKAVVSDETGLNLQFPPDRNANGQPVGTPTNVTIAGREVYYEVPQQPVGIIFFFHGCVHNAYDHWQSQPGCEWCRGLPQEVSHLKQALSLGYAFVAINSIDRNVSFRCYSWHSDSPGVLEVMSILPQQLGLEGLPVYVAGVSAGGSFGLRLPLALPGQISGIVAEVIGLGKNGSEWFDWSAWPPTGYVAMKNDPETQDKINENIQMLQAAGVPAQKIYVEERVVYWPNYFSDQDPNISPELSEKTVLALVDMGLVNMEGLILKDPRYGVDFDWRTKLQQLVPELNGTDTANSVAADASSVSELMNTAYAQHEIIGDYFTAMLLWLERGGTGNLTQLAEEYVIRRPALLKGDRLQPGEKPATAGDPPIKPWLSPPPPPSPPPLPPAPPSPSPQLLPPEMAAPPPAPAPVDGAGEEAPAAGKSAAVMAVAAGPLQQLLLACVAVLAAVAWL